MDTSYNEYDLNMRRKVEILKYNSSTKNGTITKSKRWGQIVNTNARLSSTTNLSYVDCPLDDLIETPTSNCDVPGPITTLKYDPKVPLYNYLSKQDIYI